MSFFFSWALALAADENSDVMTISNVRVNKQATDVCTCATFSPASFLRKYNENSEIPARSRCRLTLEGSLGTTERASAICGHLVTVPNLIVSSAKDREFRHLSIPKTRQHYYLRSTSLILCPDDPDVYETFFQEMQ
jgi:hypothetical protein